MLIFLLRLLSVDLSAREPLFRLEGLLCWAREIYQAFSKTGNTVRLLARQEILSGF